MSTHKANEIELFPDGSPRLLVAKIDHTALHRPDQTFATIPKDAEDISQGLEDITYSTFAKAIDHAAWWLDTVHTGADPSTETISYWGPPDLQYVIMLVACMKTRRTILLFSYYTSFEGLEHLFNEVGCQCLLVAGGLPPGSNIAALSNSRPKLRQIDVPSLSTWLMDPTKRPYPYHETFASSAERVACVLQTSGTTSLPKPIYYTNRRIAAFGTAHFLSRNSTRIRPPQYEHKKFHTNFLPCHVWGCSLALFHPVYDGMQPVMAIPKGGVDAEYAKSVLDQCGIQTVAYVSGLLESMIHDTKALMLLRNLDQVVTGGCPIGEDLIKTLEQNSGTEVYQVYGSTEIYPTVKLRPYDSAREAQSYFAFDACMGLSFEDQGDGLFEMTQKRAPGLEEFQGIFDTYYKLTTFRTGDLFMPHPIHSGYWRIVGRTDDVLSLSSGRNLVAAPLERQIAHHELVSGVYIGQSGRPRPIVLLEPSQKANELSERKFLDEVWPQVLNAMKSSVASVPMRREYLISTGPVQKLIRTTKLAVDRRRTELHFKDLIDRAYGFSL